MKVLVTGVKGQLGYSVVRELKSRGHIPVGVDIDEMDITDALQTGNVIKNADVDAVIHCAAYTAVDEAEDNVDLCRKVNVLGTENIAEACGKLDIKMVYISTDYVFGGEGTRPWEPDDKAEPLNVYGQSKYDGEVVVRKHVKRFFILRTAWVFGENGHNFIKTMIKLGGKNPEVNVVNDQVGSPTYTTDLAVLLVDFIESDRYGIYHATNDGYCSWYEFALEIFRQANMNVKVNPVSSEEFPSKAKRPHNSRMSKKKLDENGFKHLPTWQDALKRFLESNGLFR